MTSLFIINKNALDQLIGGAFNILKEKLIIRLFQRSLRLQQVLPEFLL